jgi:urease accessory protein
MTMQTTALRLISTVPPRGDYQDILVLPFEQRQKTRQRVQLKSGRAAGLFLLRGTVLRGGECLQDDSGQVVVLVEAALEQVSVAHADEPLLLTRAAYHLGNRHVPVQVTSGALIYLHDHVLDDLMRGLGLQVTAAQRPFEPEAGAYAGGHHGHAHGHAHNDHDHGHTH